MSEAFDPTTHAYSGDLHGKSPPTFDLNLIYVASFLEERLLKHMSGLIQRASSLCLMLLWCKRNHSIHLSAKKDFCISKMIHFGIL
ncbi:hypothetical protein RJT34_02423 [Clitoria ternatea]|uniref:Uncharacterized protein n=1 Tax=Clitoria ternatea TaxID=43366 RepID=A0AAN9KHR9_CLITE